MKKIFKSLALVATAAAVLASCQKPEIENPVKEEGTKVVYFGTEVNDLTKASLTTEDDANFIANWENNDVLNVSGFVFNEWYSDFSGTWDAEKKAFAVTGADEYFDDTNDFIGVYPQAVEGVIDFGSARTQDGNNYAGKYDVMCSEATSLTLVEGETFVLPMDRQTAIAYFHLTSTLPEEEKIVSATLSVNENLAGSFLYDKGEIEPDATENSIILSFTNAPSVRDLKLWFNVFPGEYTGLTLEVETENHTLTIKNSKTVTYEQGMLYKVAGDATAKYEEKEDPDGDKFVKVVADCDDWSGTYLIVYKGSDESLLAFNSGLETLDAVSNGASITADANGDIALDETTAGYIFTVASMDGGYSVKASNGKYIYGTTGSNKLNTNNDPSANTFTWVSAKNYLQVTAPTYLTYNNASGQYRFRYMKSDNQNTAFYRLNGKFNPNFPILSVVDQEVAGSYVNVTIPVTSNREWTAEITGGSEYVDGGELTTASGSGDGNITFKFAAANDSYFETQEVTLRVTAETKVVDITITHKTKTGVNLQINGQTSNITDNVDADATQYVANITANFPEWTVLAYSIDGVAQATSGDNCVRTYDAEAGTGAVTLKFPSNEATTEATAAKSIVLTVGYGEYISRTITITQDGDEPEGGDTDGWVKTDLANINSGDVFVMVSGTYAIPNDADATPSAVQVTILGSKITSTVPANLKWNVTGNATDGYTFRPNGDSSKALYINTTNDSGSNTCVRIGAPATGVNRNVFVYDSKTLKTKDNTTKARYINLYNNSDWRGYVSNSTSTELVFYVLNDSRTAQPDFGFSSDKASYDLYTQVGSYPTLNGALTTVTYTSSDQSVATVDADGTVHPLKEGTTVITASTSNDDPTYKPASDSYTLTITDSTPSTGGDVEVLREEFDNNSTSDSSSAITNSTFSNFSGATSKAYKSQYGGIKFGTGSANGYITSKTLDLSNSFTVKLNARKYGSDSGKIQVTVGSTTKEITPTADDTEYTLDFNAATASSTVKIGTSAKRAYIDNVVIIRHD